MDKYLQEREELRSLYKVQNYPIYYRIEGGIFYLQRAFKGDYRVLMHTDKVIGMEAFLPNHSLITMYRKE